MPYIRWLLTTKVQIFFHIQKFSPKIYQKCWQCPTRWGKNYDLRVSKLPRKQLITVFTPTKDKYSPQEYNKFRTFAKVKTMALR